MFKRGLPLLVASLLVLLLGAYWALYFTGNNTEYAKGHQYLVTIKPGMTTADIADLLHKKHLVKTPEAFRMEARLRGLAGKLEAGQYEIEGGMSNREIVDILSQGQTYVVKFTVPEGFNVAKTAKNWKPKGWETRLSSGKRRGITPRIPIWKQPIPTWPTRRRDSFTPQRIACSRACRKRISWRSW